MRFAQRAKESKKPSIVKMVSVCLVQVDDGLDYGFGTIRSIIPEFGVDRIMAYSYSQSLQFPGKINHKNDFF